MRAFARVLQAQSGAALLRGRLITPLALAAGAVRHGAAFVEHDDPIESDPVQSTIWRTRETLPRAHRCAAWRRLQI